jgi:hypothetical protein
VFIIWFFQLTDAWLVKVILPIIQIVQYGPKNIPSNINGQADQP